jgi:hypothetical protein
LRAEISEASKQEIAKHVESGDYSGGARSEQQPFAVWIMAMTPEEKLWAIPLARKKRDFYDREEATYRQGASTREEWNGVLAYLGDDEALKAHVEYWKRNPYGVLIAVKRAASGKLPLYYADELFLDETFEVLGTDAPSVKISFQVASLIVGYLHYNRHYPQEVRDWAGRTDRNRAGVMQDMTTFRNVIRQWYRANEAFIRAEQYDKVIPGEELPPRPDIDGAGAKRIELNPPKLEAAAGRNAAQTQAPEASGPDQKNERWRTTLFVAAGLALFACLVVWAVLWHRRRPGSS